MKIQILSGNYCAFAIQSNRCCLSVRMHSIFKGFKSEFDNFVMCFEEHLREYKKLVLTHFLKKIDLRLSRTQPTKYK